MDRSLNFDPAIALFEGASLADGRVRRPLRKIAVIRQEEFEALWTELGIDLLQFMPGSGFPAPPGFGFPSIYLLQNYVVFSHPCHPDNIDQLLLEAHAAICVIRSDAAKQALKVLIDAAAEMKSEGRGILFRQALGDYPESKVLFETSGN